MENMQSNISNNIHYYNNELLNNIKVKNLENCIKTGFLDPLELKKFKPYSNNLMTYERYNRLVNICDGLRYGVINSNSMDTDILFACDKYYNVCDLENPTSYTISIGKQKIVLFIDVNGIVNYKELKKLELFLGKPLFELNIVELYSLLKKLSLSIKMNIEQIRNSIYVHELNKEVINQINKKYFNDANTLNLVKVQKIFL